MTANTIRLLYFSSDRHPARRMDVAVLFGDQLAARGHRIDFVLQSEEAGEKAYRAEWRGCGVYVGAMDSGETRLGRLRKHFYGILHDLRMAWILRNANYDFFQLKDKYVSSLFLMPIAHWAKIRFVYWLSFPFPEESMIKCKEKDARYPFFYWLRGWVFDFIFYRLIAPNADFIFVQSEQMKRDLAARGVVHEKMMAVPMGVSSSLMAFGEAPESSSVVSGSVVYLGTLARVRKMDFLIRVFSRVVKKASEATLVLVGGGDDEYDMEILRQEAKRLGIEDRIVFTGWLPMDKAVVHVRKAAVCVSPFFPTPILNSTSPTKLVEYMALGKAVVANEHPEQSLVIEQSGAGLCVPYDEQQFAQAIVELLEDPARCREMGKRGRDYVEQHRTYERIADDVERKYLELL